MIAHLSGIVLDKQQQTLILDVHGVGYLVHTLRSILEKAELGDQIELRIHTIVREDLIALYGFATREQHELFKLALSVSGIGPKSALEILNAPIANVRQAIVRKDAAFLTRIPGIGKKTAERIIVDLQGKIKEETMEEDADRPEHEDIVQALISLGYHRQQVLTGLKKIPTEINKEEEIIKYFLQNI